jgi:hypothetical protein
MNQEEMNQVASLLEDAFAVDYVANRLAKKDLLPLAVSGVVRAVCIHLRKGNIENVIAEVKKDSFSNYPETKKVLLQYLVPSSVFK